MAAVDGESQGKRRTNSAVVVLREAKLAISDIVRALEPLRSRVALVAARARRGDVKREALASDCDLVAAEIGEMRAALLLRLMDAPQAVAGHSRVFDVERAIDSLERQLQDARAALR